MEIEEEKEFSFKENNKNQSVAEMKEVLVRDQSMALQIGQNSIQHFCEFIAGIFTSFASGLKV